MNKPTPGLVSDEAIVTTFEPPQHWSPEQALAVWECLEDLAWLIWTRYEGQLIALIQRDLHHGDTAQLELFDPDDDIPF